MCNCELSIVTVYLPRNLYQLTLFRPYSVEKSVNSMKIQGNAGELCISSRDLCLIEAEHGNISL